MSRPWDAARDRWGYPNAAGRVLCLLRGHPARLEARLGLCRGEPIAVICLRCGRSQLSRLGSPEKQEFTREAQG